jgi:hypothetical protein
VTDGELGARVAELEHVLEGVRAALATVQADRDQVLADNERLRRRRDAWKRAARDLHQRAVVGHCLIADLQAERLRSANEPLSRAAFRRTWRDVVVEVVIVVVILATGGFICSLVPQSL